MWLKAAARRLDSGDAEAAPSLGWFDLPALQLDGRGSPTTVAVDAAFHVLDAADFAELAAHVLQGRAATWHVAYVPTASWLGQTVKVDLSRTVQLPAAPPSDGGQAHNGTAAVARLDISPGNNSATELRASASFTIINPSQLEVADLGPVAFALHSVGEDGAVLEAVELGVAVVAEFALVRGLNELGGADVRLRSSCGGTSNASAAEACQRHLAAFLGRFLSGTDQEVALRGPVKAGPQEAAGFLLPALRPLLFRATVLGLPSALLRSGLASRAHALVGHVSETGRACSVLSGGDCMRGTDVVAANALSRGVTLTDLSLDVDLHEDLAYNAVLRGPALGILGSKKVSCYSQGRRLARLYSAPGMWSDVDEGRASEASVALPAHHGGPWAAGPPAPVDTSFLLAARPQPSSSDAIGDGDTEDFGGGDNETNINGKGHQRCYSGAFKGLNPYDCCFITSLPAAACLYAKRGSSLIPLSVRGNLTLVVDEFALQVPVTASSLPLAVADLTEPSLMAPATLSCKDVSFQSAGGSDGLGGILV